MEARIYPGWRSFLACTLVLSLAAIGASGFSARAAGLAFQDTTPTGPAAESAAQAPAGPGGIIEVPCGDAVALEFAISTSNNSPEADTIVLNPQHEASCTYTFTAGYLNGPSCLPDVLGALTIEGNGATVERSAAAITRSRIFYIAGSANVSINDLTIKGGSIKGTDGATGAPGSAGSAGAQGSYPGGLGGAGTPGGAGGNGGVGGNGEGGGIYVAAGGHLTLDGCLLTDNHATGGTGGAGGAGGAGGTGGRGGDGRDGSCSLFGCDASTGGGAGSYGGDGGDGGTGGTGGQGQGGAIYNAGTLSLVRTKVSGNTVTGGLGGTGGPGAMAARGGAGGQGGDSACFFPNWTAAANGGGGGRGGDGGYGGWGGAGGEGNGGGIFNAGMLTMDRATITENRENSGGSGGSGGTAGNLNFGGGGGNGGAGRDCTFVFIPPGNGGALGASGADGISHSGGSGAGSNGGGAYNTNAGSMTVEGSWVTANNATMNAGGFYNQGALVVHRSTLGGNTANSDGYGASHSGGYGGAIYQWEGSLTVTGSTIMMNTAYGGGGIAIKNSAVEIVNSTLSTNSATGGSNAHGGGIYIFYASPPEGWLHVSHSTITNNSATGYGGGIYHSSSNTWLKGSILVLNEAPYEGDCFAPVHSGGYNLGPTEACGFTATGDLQSYLPHLGPLAENNGATWTHAVLPGSEAIDVGVCTDLDGEAVTEDQRGIARPVAGGCDIGAYEARNTLTIELGDAQTAWTGRAVCHGLLVKLLSENPDVNQTPSGARVTYTPPASGAGLSITVPSHAYTQTGGSASLAATANDVAGEYEVTVSAAGVSVPVVFHLRNAGGLVATIAPRPAGGVNITLPYYAGIEYRVWHAATPYQIPGTPETTELVGACTSEGALETCADEESLGPLGGSRYYMVRAWDDCGSFVDPNGTGRFGYPLATP